jgi:phenylacetate-CoA ligase
MSIGIRRPWEAVNYQELVRSFPPPPEYFERAYYASPEEIDRIKLSRVADRAQRAQAVPFFRERWAAADFEPRDIRSLDDLKFVPTYTVDDIRLSIEAHPPAGNYQGIELGDALREPMRVHMSGGSTGEPRPTLYTQWDREVGGVLTARGAYMQGLRPGDVVLNSWSYGLHNGAFAFDEALHRWLNCIVITTSTGNVTSTRKQVELAKHYKAAGILTTGDYLLRIVEEARSMGLDPKEDLSIRSLATNVGNEKELSALFGIPAFQTYGFHEVQYVSVECEAKGGLHIFEDAFHIDVVDPETGEPLPDGETGALVVTELYKTGSPQFRYNIMDLASLHPREQCACGSWLRRMSPFAGRGDNMVKLRGVNVWPEALGEIAASVGGASTDYVVTAVRAGNRDEMNISVATDIDPGDRENLRLSIEKRIQEKLGVSISAVVVGTGEIDHLTKIETSPKPIRFRDERQDRT